MLQSILHFLAVRAFLYLYDILVTLLRKVLIALGFTSCSLGLLTKVETFYTPAGYTDDDVFLYGLFKIKLSTEQTIVKNNEISENVTAQIELEDDNCLTIGLGSAQMNDKKTPCREKVLDVCPFNICAGNYLFGLYNTFQI